MKRIILAGMLVLLFTSKSDAQTKVFQEVGNSISTTIRPILQDNSLVGYLSFTELERANADSFHYRLNIMDENLNDIGKLDFTEIKLDLQSVAFEQDVLCLAYLKSNFVGYGTMKRRERKQQLAHASVSVFTQFVSLAGKIIGTNTVKANVKILDAYNRVAYDRTKMGSGGLKQGIQLKNMPGRGFVCFYGDESKSYLNLYDTAGKNIWHKDFLLAAESYNILPSRNDIYMLYKKKDKIWQGGYWLTGYSLETNKAFDKYELRDKNGNPFAVRAFENDPVTGRPYLSGSILHPRKGNALWTVKQVGKGSYTGLFTAQIKGEGTSKIEMSISDWYSHTQADFSSKGRYLPTKSIVNFEPGFKDFQGNTYFVANSFKKKPRWGNIILSAATVPLIVPPLWITGNLGTQKIQSRDALLFKQDKNGHLSLVNNIPAVPSSFVTAKISFLGAYDYPTFSTAVNSETKSNYLIVKDKKKVSIYSVNQKKVIRTIPRKDGSVTTDIYPAKEGHIMVSEYNKKEKTRKFSIEAL